MKKIFALLISVFFVLNFTGCAVNRAQTYTDYDPGYGAEEPEEFQPKPVASKAKSQPRLAATPKRQPVKKPPVKVQRPDEPQIVTASLYPIPKFVDVDNDLTIVSMTPAAYSTQHRCNEVYFFAAVVTPESGYHNLVDITMSETKDGNKYSCKYFGSAVVYKVKPNPIVKENVKYEDVIRKYVTD